MIKNKAGGRDFNLGGHKIRNRGTFSISAFLTRHPKAVIKSCGTKLLRKFEQYNLTNTNLYLQRNLAFSIQLYFTDFV